MMKIELNDGRRSCSLVTGFSTSEVEMRSIITLAICSDTLAQMSITLL